MSYTTSVSQEQYSRYLDFKFSLSKLPKVLLFPYKCLYYTKNYITNYHYPREYKYEINQDGVTKCSGSNQTHFNWNTFSSYEVVDNNIALYKNTSLVLYIYTGNNLVPILEEFKNHLKTNSN